MVFSLVLVLMALMATGGGRRGARGQRSVLKRTHAAEEFESSDPDCQAKEAEEAEEAEEEPVTRLDKGKGIADESSCGGGATTWERRAKRIAEVPLERPRAYSVRSCIAERHVNCRNLTEQFPEFGRLLLRAPIEPAGNVGARTPFCVELIHEFYMRGVVLAEDDETGSYIFETTIYGKRLAVTPHDIGELLGMVVDTSGFHHTAGPLQYSTHWDTVIGAICKPGARTDRAIVESKDLRPEYHLLSLILCYNVQPTIGAKWIRWDRLVLLYLLGHPEQAYRLNMNIPS